MSVKNLPAIDWDRVDKLIAMAVEEDIGGQADFTSEAVVPEGSRAKAVLLCKEPLVCAGLPVAEKVFRSFGVPSFKALVPEGTFCLKDTIVAEAEGPAVKLLSAERTVLNFIQRLSGIATVSKKYADAVRGTKTVILDTRKTIPGWRNLEKYAVAAGGASNHRFGLYDRVMIKDNHREMAGLEGLGGIGRSVERARQKYPELEIEVEVDDLDQLREALEAGPEYILLDNMSDELVAEAVKITDGTALLEASGGITFERLPRLAATGVDFISAGALTHSAKAADISMELHPVKGSFKTG
jgi:nicotinate-nucleotide pyrophosphorylase (carboxylating)